MENTAVRFSAKDKENTNVFFGLYLFTKLIIIFVVISVIFFFGHSIFGWLGRKGIIEYIPYFFVGFLGESLLFVNDTYLQAIQKFKLRAIINIFRYIISLLFILLLYLNQAILLKYVFFLYLLPLLISVFFLLKYVHFLKSYFSKKIARNMFLEIIHYEKWMLMVSIPNNTLGRIDFLYDLYLGCL